MKQKILNLIKNQKFQKLTFISMIVLLFSPMFFNLNDPDYFWHYKAGQYITETRSVPKVDPYSFSYPNFQWVNHEWLSDTILYNVETHFSPIGLSIFYLAIFGILIYLLLKDYNITLLGGVTFLFALGSFSGYLGVREQMYSFLFFSLFWIIFKKQKYFYLPPLFLLWANLHGGFSLGILLLPLLVTIDTVTNILQKKKVFNIPLLIASGLSFLATLINPFGLRIYEEVIRTVGDNYLTKHIFEWLPITSAFNNRYVLFLALLFSIVIFLKKRRPIEHLLISLILIIMSFKSIKYIPYVLIITIPLLLTMVLEIESMVTFTRENLIKLLKGPFIIGLICIGFLYFNPYLFSTINVDSSYPLEALTEVRKMNGKNIFNSYGWGGLFIRYAPNNKYFIDGRMPSWRDRDNYPFRDYMDMVSCENIDQNLSRYEIDLFVIPVNTKGNCNLVKELKNRDWKEKYIDSVAVILEKS